MKRKKPSSSAQQLKRMERIARRREAKKHQLNMNKPAIVAPHQPEQESIVWMHKWFKGVFG